MKIGIITYWDSSDNYGQLLQCYALQAHLRTLGHSPFLIRYKPTDQYKSGFKLKKIFEYIRHFPAYVDFIIQKRNSELYSKLNPPTSRKFDEFRSRMLTMSEEIYNDDSLMKNPPSADAYICGSDQIWGGGLMYYMPFVKGNAKRIAYAPSFGGVNPFDGPNKSDIINLLKNYDFLSARELSGVEMLKNNGFANATQVVDPTLLLTRDEYSAISEKPVKSSDAFIYLLGNTTSIGTDTIIRFLSKHNLEYTYVASQARVDKHPKQSLTIPQWLGAIENSKIVITNSFHCIVFALTFHKPFVYIPLSGGFSRMNNRIEDLLTKSSLSDKTAQTGLDKLFSDFDFTVFDTYKSNETMRTDKIFKSLLT